MSFNFINYIEDWEECEPWALENCLCVIACVIA